MNLIKTCRDTFSIQNLQNWLQLTNCRNCKITRFENKSCIDKNLLSTQLLCSNHFQLRKLLRSGRYQTVQLSTPIKVMLHINTRKSLILQLQGASFSAGSYKLGLMRMAQQDAIDNATPTSLFENYYMQVTLLHVSNTEYESTC